MSKQNTGHGGAASFNATPDPDVCLEAAIREQIFNADPLGGTDPLFAAQRWRHHCIWLIDRLEAERANHRIIAMVSVVCFFLALSYLAAHG